MAHEYWDVFICLVGGIHIRCKLVVEEQVGGEAEYTGEGLRGGNAGEEGDGAALGEAAEDDAGGGYTLVYFLFYEGVEVVAGFENAGLVVGLGEVGECGLVDRGVSDIGGGAGWDGRFRAVVQCHTSLAFACRNSGGHCS